MQSGGITSHFGGLFDGYLVEREHGLARQALGLVLVRHHQHATAFGARVSQGQLPGGEIAIGVIGTAVEGAPLAGLARHDITAVLGAGHADLFQPGFGVAAIGEAAAADELAIPAIADDQLFSALGADAPDGFGPHVHLGHLDLSLGNLLSEGSPELTDRFNPILLCLRRSGPGQAPFWR